MGYFCPKYKMHELKLYRGVMCNVNEQWWKIWRGIDLAFQNWHKEFDKFRLEGWLMGCFWPKYVMFELKSKEKLNFITPESDAKFEEKLTWGLENDMRNLAKFNQSTRKSQNWDFYWVLLSKVEYELKNCREVMC